MTSQPRPIEEREAIGLEATLRAAPLSEVALDLIGTVRDLIVVRSELDSLWFDCPDPNAWHYLLADGTGTTENGDECYIVVRGTEAFISRVEVFSAGGDYARFPEPATIRPSGWAPIATA